jgi:hypothetical protein
MANWPEQRRRPAVAAAPRWSEMTARRRWTALVAVAVRLPFVLAARWQQPRLAAVRRLLQPALAVW